MEESIKKVITAAGLFILPVLISAQCEVLLKSVEGSYTGDCKRGKAHGAGVTKGVDSYTGNFLRGYPNGKGVYTFANGDIFTGIFRRGKKIGEGKLVKADGTEITGFWKSNEYIGKHPLRYEIVRKSEFVISAGFKRKNDGDDIRVLFRKNGRIVTKSLNITTQSGSFSNITSNKISSIIGGVSFPFWARFNFEGQYVELKINQTGSWNVRVDMKN